MTDYVILYVRKGDYEMTKKAVAALVALIMVFTLLPAGVIPAFAATDTQIYEGVNYVAFGEYSFIPAEDGLYLFDVKSGSPIAVAIYDTYGSVGVSANVDVSPYRAFVACELQKNTEYTFDFRTQNGTCTVKRVPDLNESATFGSTAADYDEWYAIRPRASGIYQFNLNADLYCEIRLYRCSNGKLYEKALVTVANLSLYNADLSKDEVYLINLCGRSATADVRYSISVNHLNPATVTGHSLMLSSGDIGVIFDVEFGDGVDTTGSYMEFITGRTGKQRMNTSDAAYDSSTGIYSYTCRIGAYRMADKITPVLHFFIDGKEATVELPQYSVEDYIEYVVANPGRYNETVVTAVKALADYGHYSQQYLADLHGFEVGLNGKYDEMGTCYTSSYSNFASDILHEMSDAGYNTGDIFSNVSDNVESISYTLNLESEISMYIYVTLKEGISINEATLVNGKQLTVKQTGESTYRIEINGIKAYELVSYYDVRVNDNEGRDITYARISPFHYITKVLETYDFDRDNQLCNAVCSLYYYYDALMNITGTSGTGGNGGDAPIGQP